jgi:hypothetical protein
MAGRLGVRREWVGGLVLWEVVEQGAKAEEVALDDAKLRVGLKTNSRLEGGEQRGHEPRHGE